MPLSALLTKFFPPGAAAPALLSALLAALIPFILLLSAGPARAHDDADAPYHADLTSGMAYAAKLGALDDVRHFLTHHPESHSAAALSEAAKRGDAEMLSLMLQAGLDPNGDTNIASFPLPTPLQAAAEKGHADIVRMLLAADADANAKGDNGETALHTAAEYNRTEIAPLLLAAGANVSAKDRRGRTPLHTAARHEALDIVPLLLEAAAGLCGYGPLPFYSSARDECVLYEDCAGGACALSAEVCHREFTPPRLYDASTGACVPPTQ